MVTVIVLETPIVTPQLSFRLFAAFRPNVDQSYRCMSCILLYSALRVKERAHGSSVWGHGEVAAVHRGFCESHDRPRRCSSGLRYKMYIRRVCTTGYESPQKRFDEVVPFLVSELARALRLIQPDTRVLSVE